MSFELIFHFSDQSSRCYWTTATENSYAIPTVYEVDHERA